MAAYDLSRKLDDAELDEVEDYLARFKGGSIPNTETLDGSSQRWLSVPS